VLVLAVCVACTCTLTSAQILAVADLHSQHRMPCCPGAGGSDHCPLAHSGEPAREKAEVASGTRKGTHLWPTSALLLTLSSTPRLVLRAPLAEPLHRPPVFSLKDDLRI
jgi:hypothetical protein